MEKRSQKRAQRHERNHSGCVWGLINMFDYRHGRPTHKLITDKRHSSKHAVGAVHSKNKFEMLSNLDKDFLGNMDSEKRKRATVMDDVNKPSVKRLIEEEMFVDQDMIKNIDSVEVESNKSRLRLVISSLKIDSKRKKKSRKKSCDMDTRSLNSDSTFESELSHNHLSGQQSKDSLDLDKIIDDFCHSKYACSSFVHGCDGDDDEVHVLRNENNAIAENNARDAIREFVNQMILNGKDQQENGKFLCFEELMEALQVINSDKELLFRLVQNPNSLLLKHVQELGNAQGTNFEENSSVSGFNLSEQEAGDLRQATKITSHKQYNFFRKMVKSQAKRPAKENDNTESSNRIVVLKPDPIFRQSSLTENKFSSSLDPHDLSHFKGTPVRVSSHFSFTEIKKKLKHVMGKERRQGDSRGISIKLPHVGRGGTVFSKDNAGMKSPNKNHFFIEKVARPTFDVKKGDKDGKLRDFEVIADHKNDNYLKQRDSNLYMEAKKHLHEMLGNGDENIEFQCSKIPETLGRLLSLPEYNFSPLGSPRRDREHHFETAQTRFSAGEKPQEAIEDFQETFNGHPNPATDNLEKQSNIFYESSENKVQEINLELNFLGDHIHDNNMNGTCYSVRDEIASEDNVESVKAITALDFSYEPVDLTARKEQNCDACELFDGSRPCCLNLDISEENQPLSSPLPSPSQSSITKKIGELESDTDLFVQPSPISVLDTPFLEDVISPGNTKFEPDKVPIQPLQIKFEDHDPSPVDQIDGGNNGAEENKLIFNYVKAVLQASGLNGDQLWIKYLSSQKILDQSLFDEFLPNQLCHDQKLLFDCINEVLADVCWYYFGASPWLSFVKPGVRPTPDMKKVILKVWEGVCWYLLPFPRPHTLDQIVQKDMARCESWMDLRCDVATVGVEMGDTILAELMEDTIDELCK